ncbi:transcriptional regulator [Serratia fonticola]|uniref:helix-turn-helix domain-containing protein n=1 Tax=Serratia fonticola TaxID=47917 RepID=UPI0013778DDD|nr:helix-turn-helix transcriptional regulator [Serratia fonticola]NBJ32267.1 transcriptional regulator [Serratia fonticola]
MASDYTKKLKQIRLAEGLTQKAFSELTAIGLGTVKNYETGVKGVGSTILDKVTNHPQLTKYTLWLMIGSVAPEIGQISPTVSQAGKRITSEGCSEGMDRSDDA